MPCYHPLHAVVHTRPDGSRRVRVLPASAPDMSAGMPGSLEQITLPCGRCLYCRLRHSLEWSIRLYHHLLYRSPAVFVTLTYSPDYEPHLVHSDVGPTQLSIPDYGSEVGAQRWIKRLRKSLPRGTRISYYGCSEYGSSSLRPHYHYIIYGWRPADMYPWMRAPEGHLIYRSPHLESTWPFGHSTVGDVTIASINYVTRYSLKKRTGPLANAYNGRRPESQYSSNGMGRDWIDHNLADVYRLNDDVTECVDARLLWRKRLIKPPRYYDKVLALDDPERIMDLVRDWRRRNYVPTDRNLRDLEQHALYVARHSMMEHAIVNRGATHV